MNRCIKILFCLLVSQLMSTPAQSFAQEVDTRDTEFAPDHSSWSELESEHFTMLYPSRRESFARHTLVYAEHAYAELSQKLQTETRFKIRIKVIDRVDEVLPLSESAQNDYFVLSTWPPHNILDGPYRGDWLERAVYHHVAHILIQNTQFDISPFLTTLLYPLSYNNQFVPTWYIEGLSSWYASVHHTATPRLDSIYAAILRSDALSNDIPNLGSIMSGRRSWLGERAATIYGTAFIHDLAEKYDAHDFTRWNHENVRRLVPFTIDATTKSIFGQRLGTLYSQWQAEKTDAIWRQEISSYNPTPLNEDVPIESGDSAFFSDSEETPSHTVPDGSPNSTALRQHTRRYYTQPWLHEYPQIVPTKEAFSYVHDDGKTTRAIMLYDIQTRSRRTLTECQGQCEHHWSGDGEVLFFTDIVAENRHRSETIYYRKMSDVLSRKLRMPAHVRSFAVSDEAVYAVIIDGDAPEIYRTKLEDNASPECVYKGNQFELIEEISFWKDKQLIAVISDADSRRYDLFVFTDEGDHLHPQQLTFSAQTEMYPFAMKDGNIGYITEYDGRYDLHSLDPSRGEDKIIHAQRDGIFQPVQSEDGALYYTEIQANGTVIAEIKEDSFAPAQPPKTRNEADTSHARSPISELYAAEIESVSNLKSTPYRVWKSLIPESVMPVLGFSKPTGLYFGLELSNHDILEHHNYTLHYAYYIRRYVHEFFVDYKWSQYKWWIRVAGGLKQKIYIFDADNTFLYFPFQIYWSTLETGTDWHFPFIDISFKVGYLFEHNEIVMDALWSYLLNGINEAISELEQEESSDPSLTSDVKPRPSLTSALTAELELSHIHKTYRTIPGQTGYKLLLQVRIETPWLGADYYTFINLLDLSLSWSMPWLETNVFLIDLQYGFSSSENVFRNAFEINSSTGFDFNEPLKLHGYHAGNIIGNQYLYAHAEYTLPLYEVRTGFPNIPVGLNQIGLGLFAESALVWNFIWDEDYANDMDIRNLKCSMGVEAYFDGTLGFNYHFRLKFGYAGGLTSGGAQSYYLEFGLIP